MSSEEQKPTAVEVAEVEKATPVAPVTPALPAPAPAPAQEKKSKEPEHKVEPKAPEWALDIDVYWLKEILGIQSYSNQDKVMLKYLSTQLTILSTEQYAATGSFFTIEEDTYGNVYVTSGVPKEGQFYPAVVAHIDTVHRIRKDLTVVEVNGTLFGMDMTCVRPAGIGGDDKVGVYIALEMLRTLPVCKVAFFRNEEIGCLGSGKADLKFFKDCAFVLQADRRGNSDFIQYSNGCKLFSKKFFDAIEPTLLGYGYSKADGTMTDIGELKDRGLGISVANVSCGYYAAHSDNEFVEIGDVTTCLNLFYDLCRNFAFRQWKHVYEKPRYPVQTSFTPSAVPLPKVGPPSQTSGPSTTASGNTPGQLYRDTTWRGESIRRMEQLEERIETNDRLAQTVTSLLEVGEDGLHKSKYQELVKWARESEKEYDFVRCGTGAYYLLAREETVCARCGTEEVYHYEDGYWCDQCQDEFLWYSMDENGRLVPMSELEDPAEEEDEAPTTLAEVAVSTRHPANCVCNSCLLEEARRGDDVPRMIL